MPLSQLEVSNFALSEIPAGTIASMGEKSLAANECNRHYGQVVGEMLEEFGYDLAIERVALAETTNDRASEWGYAYAVPANMASPLRIIPNFTNTAGSVVLLVGQTLAPTGNIGTPDPYRISYIVADQLIYTNEPLATLEYVRDDPSIATFPRMLIRAIALELAARIVMPLMKSETREKVLMGKAELAKQRAMADNLNRQPSNWDVRVTEEERARYGWY